MFFYLSHVNFPLLYRMLKEISQMKLELVLTELITFC